MKKLIVVSSVCLALLGVTSCSSSSGNEEAAKSLALKACDSWDTFVTSPAYVDSFLSGSVLEASDVEPLVGAAEASASSASESASNQDVKDEYEAFSIILGQYKDLATSGSNPGMQSQLADDISGVCTSYRN